MDGFRKVPDSFGKANFLADGEVGKAAPSNSNFHFNSGFWEELFNSTNDSVVNSTMGTQLNRQQCGELGGTSSEVDIRALRKRLNDKRYRERLRQGKMQMTSQMGTLYNENENLKKENERLQCEHVSMNETLQAQAKLIDQLKSDLDKLNDEYKKQNVLVQRLSELLASCPDFQLENERLKLENDQLRRNARSDYNTVLAEENVKLILENKVLKVQNDALCGKLISDNDKKHA